MKDTRSRKWQITINNPADKGYTHEKIKSIMLDFISAEYWCMCDEVGENGTYHIHIYMSLSSASRFTTVKKRFEGTHIEMANGTSQQNRDYIRKEGKWEKDKKKETNLIETFYEVGEMPIERQGQRNDIHDLYDMIKQGMSNAEILEMSPENMLRLDKIERARQVYLESKYRSEWRKLEVIYLWGDTGTGKTSKVVKDHGYENVYRVTDYDHPFDSYRQQPVVIFEEFHSGIKIGDMLNYLDGHPVELPCRYVNKVACYDKVYIISNMPIESQYQQIQEQYPQTFEALLRRINNTIKMPSKKTEDKTNGEYKIPDGFRLIK